MPLPKPPARPATILELDEQTLRRVRRKSSEIVKAAAGKSADAPAAPQPEPLVAGDETTAVLERAPAARRDAVAPADAPRAEERASRRPAVLMPPRPAPAPAEPRPGPRRRRDSAGRILFVLDTNVLMHDPTCLFRFAEHDIYLPMMTLEELDAHKRGMSEVARNVRQASRALDALIAASDARIEDGIPLSSLGHTEARGRLFFQTQALEARLPESLPIGKADNHILGVIAELERRHPEREIVLVSKDINMRIKASTLGLAAEDYFNDQVLEDADLLYTGMLELPADFWDRHGRKMESWQKDGFTYYRVSGPMVRQMSVNQFVWYEGEMPLLARVRSINGDEAVLQTLRDFTHARNAVWGITARNREQNFALNLLLDPEIDFVTLLGQAGTGKTLLTLAAGLAQVLETKRFTEIIMTRATVPVGEDIGYLPGTEEEKMQPWMGALEDNLEVLNQGDPAAGEWGRSATQDLIRSRIRVKAMSFMRGRTFINKFLIIDEAQNLTPKQMKTLITRAGPGTKVVCLGNIAQIDTPYLTEGSSGLSFVVERFRNWAHAGHITLQRGERSRLADFATEAL